MLVINSVLLALQSEDIAVEQVAARRDLAPGFYKASDNWLFTEYNKLNF